MPPTAVTCGDDDGNVGWNILQPMIPSLLGPSSPDAARIVMPARETRDARGVERDVSTGELELEWTGRLPNMVPVDRVECMVLG